MITTARFCRVIAAVSLIATALLSVLWVLLRPTGADQLAAIEAAGPLALVSGLAFAMAQLPFLIGMLGVAVLTRHGAPWLTIVGGSIAFLGGFCHAVMGGFQLGSVMMAADTAHRDVYVALLASPPPPALMVLMMAGTIGTALGLVLIGAGLMRAGVGGRWIPYALWAFVLVEFAGTSVTSWASLASGLLYLAAFVGLAIAVWQSPLSAWMPREAVLGRRVVREGVGV